jgi:hypothetical protein
MAALDSTAVGESENTVRSAVVGRWPTAGAMLSFHGWVRDARFGGRTGDGRWRLLHDPQSVPLFIVQGDALENVGQRSSRAFSVRITSRKEGPCRVEK